MKNKARFLLFIILFFWILNVNSEDNSWYPFIIPEKLDANSPLNIGKFVLDAPAGKHGFVKVKNGHFYFKDNTRVKFWGTNLCVNACFPTKQEAIIIVDRIAFFGFNAVRLHHMDSYFEPQGIFKDTPIKKTTILSQEQLDRLDYLIYQLKQRGIYIDMNLLVSRHFTPADGVKEAGKLEKAAKPASLFDPTLIQLQKKYAQDLLTHYNKYTKLRYCDDPAIALIEITNENSLFKSYKKPMPDYYKKQLENKWDEWQKKQNIATQKTKEAFYIDLERQYFKEMLKFLKEIIGIKIPITGIGGYQVKEDVISMQDCDYIDKHSYWDHPRFAHKRWDSSDFRIHNKSLLLNPDLGIIGRFLSSRPKATDQTKAKPYTITEWNHCYPNQYAYETPVLLASYALKNDWDGLFQFNFSNGWKSEPQFDNIQNYFEIMANPQKLILNSLGSLLFHQTKDLKITLNPGIFRLDSDILQGMAGFIKDKIFEFDTFTLSADENGAVFVYSPQGKSIKESDSLIIVAISEIKNKNSGWDSKGGFNWGTAPTLLKNMQVKISLKNGKSLNFSTQKENSPFLKISIK